MANQDTIQISEFSFYEFCLSAQKAVKAGYEFSDKNEYMPQGYAGSYSATLIKTAYSEDKAQVDTQPKVDQDQQQQDAPKPSNAKNTKGARNKTQ